MKRSIISGAILAAVMAAPVLAQTTVEERKTTVEHNKSHGTAAGAATGAVAGAVVAGPIGAVVGGIGGAAVGHHVAPPDRTKTYATRQRVESSSYRGDIRVGRHIGGEVAWRPIPDDPRHQWAYLDGKRVVVDRTTHDVVAVY